VIGGVTSVLVSLPFDLVALIATGIVRAANVGFLRLATLFLAQAFDLATFSIMVARHGAGAEANPIVSDLFDSLGMPAVVVAKLALVLLVGALFVMAHTRDRRGVWALIGGLPLALAITAGLIGGITNAATFLA
jgi:hypothetical protein